MVFQFLKAVYFDCRSKDQKPTGKKYAECATAIAKYTESETSVAYAFTGSQTMRMRMAMKEIFGESRSSERIMLNTYESKGAVRI